MSIAEVVPPWLSRFAGRHWLELVVAGVLYIMISLRVALQVRKIGRRPLPWFFITLFFTAIPAAMLFLWHNFGWLVRGESRPTPESYDDCEADDR